MDFNEDEKIFQGERNVKYLFQKHESNNLVVIFSGFSKRNDIPRYNYIRSLLRIKANRLYILDDYGYEPLRGAYYLCENKDFSIERSVIELISSIQETVGASPSDVILAGSSKGGYASLYFGIKYGFGAVVSGAPQTLLGNYLCNEIPNNQPVAEFIAGGASHSHIQYLNNLLPNVIQNAENFPELYLHIGTGEPHYKNHFLPLLSMLHEREVNPTLDLADYSEHNGLSQFFPPYLVSMLGEITEKRLALNESDLQRL